MVSAVLCSNVLSSRCLSASTARQQLMPAMPLQACRRSHRQQTQALFGGNKEGGGGNPFGDMGKLMENMKKAQEVVQVKAAQVQKELAETTFEGFSDDETVCVRMTGNQEPIDCDITDEAYEKGSEALAALISEAMKDAHTKSSAGMKSKMGALAQELGLPAGAAGRGGF